MILYRERLIETAITIFGIAATCISILKIDIKSQRCLKN
jgi:hypothetical protein